MEDQIRAQDNLDMNPLIFIAFLFKNFLLSTTSLAMNRVIEACKDCCMLDSFMQNCKLTLLCLLTLPEESIRFSKFSDCKALSQLQPLLVAVLVSS